MFCHDVGDVLKHLKREHIEVGETLIPVSDSLSQHIEILIDALREKKAAVVTKDAKGC